MPTAFPPPASILVCQLRQIGDVLLATPALSMLRQAWPQAAIHVLTEAKCAPVLEHNPDVDRVWALDKRALPRLRDQVAFYQHVAAQDYDLVVDFQQLPRIRWVLMLSILRSRLRGHRQRRLSFTPPWYNRWLYTDWARPKDGYSAMSKASILSALGLEWTGQRPRFVLLPEEIAWAERWLAEHGIDPDEHTLVTVDPSHRRETRRWSAGQYGQTLRLALARRPELRFLVLWGPGEEELAHEVRDASGMPDKVLTPPALLTLREMGAVMSRASVHFGNCSAPRHFAVALGVPSLSVMGSTSSAWCYPAPEHQDVVLGLDCQPCNENLCPQGHIRCLTDLAPEPVAEALLSHLDRFGLPGC